MNQTFKLSEVLNANAIIMINEGEESAKIVLGSDGTYYLLQNLWDGCPCPDGCGEYRYSWALEVVNEGSVLAKHIPPQANGSDYTFVVTTAREWERAKKAAEKARRSNPFWRPEFDFGSNKYEPRVRDYHTSRRSGYPTYVGKHKSDYCIGVELECISTKSPSQVLKESNWISFEHDGSLDSGGIEFVTAPIPSDKGMTVEFWEPLCDYLNSQGVKSYSKSCCGMHVHVGTGVLGSTEDEKKDTLARVLYFYQILLPERVKTNVFKRSASGYCNALALSTARSIKDLKRFLKNGAERIVYDEKKLDTGRYSELNCNTGNSDKTIEFRRGKGSINAKRIAAIVALCCTLCEYCRKKSLSRLSYEDYVKFVGKKLPKNHPLVDFIKTNDEE